MPSALLRPASLNYFGLLGPSGAGFGQVTYQLPELLLQPREYFDLHFNVSGQGSAGEGAPAVDVQGLESDGKGDQLDLSLRELDEEPTNATSETGPDGSRLVNFVAKHPAAARYQDDWEEGVSYESLVASGLQTNRLQRIRVANRDPAGQVRAQLKVVLTERFSASRGRSNGGERLPASFEEVSRTKPKVPGLKEGSFIQGSRKVMETFKVTSLTPFLPASSKVY